MTHAKVMTELERLREDLRAGTLTPRDAAERALARANSNAGHNVYLSLDREWAPREAEELPRRFGMASERPLLYGLPVSLKDCFDLAGFKTTDGTRFYAQRNAPAANDSAVASRLRAQGAVIVGKTHVHPLTFGITGENPDYGDCAQPKRPDCLTGGSTSGGAASVQEGSAVAAIGTDTGGSIRVPSALCGLAGYRASIELAHERKLWGGGIHLAPSFDTLGWVYRDLRDGPVLADALFGIPRNEASDSVPRRQLRIGVVSENFLDDCEPQVLDVFRVWQERLRAADAELTEIDVSWWNDAMRIFAPIQAHEAAVIHAPTTGGDFSVFEPSIAERLAWGASIAPAKIVVARHRQDVFRTQVDAILQEYDYLILPCAPSTCLKVGADHSQTRNVILRYTVPMSLAGTPVVTLPSDIGAGVQVVAARGADARLLSYSAQLGAALADRAT
jgi:Asp-tRNA(Asn)/Glu-tRNA(Gln) amidotransferase A subunit family amidase